MNPSVKNFLIQAAKNATNAALVTIAPMLSSPEQYNWHSVSGLEHMGAVVLGAVLAREALVLGPKVLAWSQTNDGDVAHPNPLQPSVKATADKYKVE